MRVVRRGGWSWGPEPRQLVADAVRALPGLLAAELERQWPEGAEGEVSSPLRLDVRVSLGELRQWARRVAREGGAAEAAPSHAAGGGPAPDGDALTAALRRALVAARPAERVAGAVPHVTESPAHTPTHDARARAAALLNVLVAWRAAGTLEATLLALPEPALAAWHRALLECPAGALAVEAPGASTAAMATVLAPFAARVARVPAPSRQLLRVLAAVELATAAGVPPTTAAARAGIDEAVPPAPPEPGGPRAGAAASAVSGVRRAAIGTEVRVASALPFLLLRTLQRIGWLGTLDTTFAAADLAEALPALAIGLATKVLPEPERGWRRRPDVLAAAATFAGDAEPRPDADVAGLARVAAPLAPALDAVIRGSLLDGRRAGDPLLYCAGRAVRLLVEPEGAFVLCHAAEPEAMAARAREAGAPLFIPIEDADAGGLAALDAAGVTFVTPAPPVRGERWRSVPGTRSPRLFTNGGGPGFRPPPDEVVARVRDTWLAFDLRPLAGRPDDPALDRALALAAAVALGTIAWELWRGREATDPLLALERLGDLEGHVRFEEHRVRVRLPLGKRFRDLKDAGLLEDVPAVPWLGFRSVVFAGG
jgi:hypothetical protein